MQFKKLFFHIAILSVTTTPLLAAENVEIKVLNNTDYYGTARFDNSSCSSRAGNLGIIKPHTLMTVPRIALAIYCKTSCTAHVYMSKDCSGNEVATVQIDPHTGVTDLQNHDKEHLDIQGLGTDITVNPASIAKSWKNWLKIF